jgi:hypothetical protein
MPRRIVLAAMLLVAACVESGAPGRTCDAGDADVCPGSSPPADRAEGGSGGELCPAYCRAAVACTGGDPSICDGAFFCQTSDALVNANGCDRGAFYACLMRTIDGACATWRDCNGRWNTERGCHETHCRGPYPMPNLCP